MPSPSVDTGRFHHLHVHSEFSFLNGASALSRLVAAAAEDNQTVLALTDHDNLCGAPEFSVACKKAGIKPIHGAEFTLDSGHVVALAKNRAGYTSLCELLTAAHLEHERGQPLLSEKKLLAEARELIIVTGSGCSPLAQFHRRRQYQRARSWALSLKNRFGSDFFIEVQRTFEPQQKALNSFLVSIARDLDIPIVATNNVHYTAPELSSAQDILTCIRHLITVDEPHAERRINAELYLKPQQMIAALFPDLPEAILNTLTIAERCEGYSIGDIRFMPRFGERQEYPERQLTELAYQGARWRYGELSSDLKKRLDYELLIINDLGFADYFLVVHDLVNFAKSKRIRHAGRGSAADSVVAYCLDITKVDSFHRNLRFERFINPERRYNLPDIDIDFDARYRDDVTAYVTEKYGKDHAATVCTYSRFRARSAIRDVAKALGFSVADIDSIAKNTHWATSAKGLRHAIGNRPELKALNISERKFSLLLDLCAAIDDLPRHISTHLGGVVITGDPIWEISPLQMAAKGVQVIQYDKEGVEDLGLLKLDLLCLRMLSAVEDSVTVIGNRDKHFDYDRLPCDDPDTFALIQSADTAGAFQIESPAQMSLHPRLHTRTYEDIVASVALIRPGPVKGEMVEPFIRRRNGQEKIAVTHPAIDKILGHTYGVVLYQEQVVSIAIELAGFSPAQADTLRRTISHRRSGERMREIGDDFVRQAVSNGVNRDTAEKVFTWLEGYAGYGFCEAHAAAFGDTSYRSAYLLEHHPVEFYTAILNNEPMGFYPAATIINEARRRGIKILGPDVNRSDKEFTVEGGAIRVGLKQVKCICEADWVRIISERPYVSWLDFQQRCQIPRDVLENLVLCGAFSEFQANRRALLFSLGVCQPTTSGAIPFPPQDVAVTGNIPDFKPYERLCHEWDILSFSPEKHPLEFWRPQLKQKQVLPNTEIRKVESRSRILRAAGWVIRPHTPPTKSGKTVVFFSLEDETGLLNVTVFPAVYERYGHLIFSHPLLMIEGRKDKRGANSLVADKLWRLLSPGR